MSRFFSTLNYSSVNEDWRTEACALRMCGGERVLCVAGSGARALDLLAVAPVRVVAVDCNPAQTALLWLKRAALEALPYEEYVRFLGLLPAAEASRCETLHALRPRLPASVAGYWATHAELVARGVLYQGRWERFHRRLAGVLRVFHGRRVRALLGFQDVAAQRAWVEGHWNEGPWRAAFALGCSAPAIALFGDPAYRPCARGPRGRYLHRRMGALLRRVLARESFMVPLALAGALPAEDLPPHLDEHGCRRIRARLDHLEIVTGDLLDVLGSGRGFDRFSLSDVGSFLCAEQVAGLLGAVLSAARPSARVVLRQFLTQHPLPPALRSWLVREPELEQRLAADDRSFAYDFVVAEVARG